MSDIEIARAAHALPICDIAEKIGIPGDAVMPYGNTKAKIDPGYIASLHDRPDGKLILVTAISPTPAGEGKTTTSVGLHDGLSRIGKKSIVCLREPSLGPCFGMKGGAAGGGHAQVIPMEDINLHFTGDFHAIGAAHNLLSALIDNHIYWGNASQLDSRRIAWKRVVDMNDRALRSIANSLGGPGNGFPREDGFDITVASEVMAIFCLSKDLEDLQQRLSKIIIGYTREREPVTAEAVNAPGAMAVLLKDAIAPNLVQTLENNPAFIHGGPFANIAHGCNSVIATTTALKLADYVVTEAGFGADLGAEKFFDIKCRSADLSPDAAVIVATIRALKMHGGVELADLGKENVEAVAAGCSNLARHIRNVKSFGVPVVVAINRFSADTDAEVARVTEAAEQYGANHVVKMTDANNSQFAPLYDSDMPIWEKMRTIATRIYGAEDIIADKKVRDQIDQFQDGGFGNLPICVAKTQYSFSTDPNLKGAPSGHVVPIREVRLSAGAGFLVFVCGEIMTMPGLPRVPAADKIHIDDEGLIQGLF
jgi:formate--tetrahydrofolate ligase